MSSYWTNSPEYQSFRSNIAMRKLCVDDPKKEWTIYDNGPKDDKKCPIIFIPPISGTADTYFIQSLSLSAQGKRSICIDYPAYYSINEWCNGFRRLLDALQLNKVHIFGSALGGFLSQKFAEYSSARVSSMILCNSFNDTSVFPYSNQASMLWLLPHTVLKGMILDGFNAQDVESNDIANAIGFMTERLHSFSQNELASRLTLNCTPNHVRTQNLGDIPITILNLWDCYSHTESVKEDFRHCYPHAKLADLKSGGIFPFLSRSDEVNLHILIHLKNIDDTTAET